MQRAPLTAAFLLLASAATAQVVLDPRKPGAGGVAVPVPPPQVVQGDAGKPAPLPPTAGPGRVAPPPVAPPPVATPVLPRPIIPGRPQQAADGKPAPSPPATARPRAAPAA
ncbi:hypothetical protein ACE7GA_02315 [Roseomonas sp. CCTCC AB2023176]|uniref:hypothetical protein n=1 Tax=Roseomonas sp. CCTCC AB2023176 TaxID=3342640 RepID=UPI0035D8AB53